MGPRSQFPPAGIGLERDDGDALSKYSVAVPAARCVRAALRIQGAARHSYLGAGHHPGARSRNHRRGEGVNFAAVEKIAAAILYEGYILYPYRPTAIKNRQRWNFGTLYPRVYAQAQRPEEPYRLVAECLVAADAEAALDVRLRFLQLLRQPNAPALAWDEAVERTSEHTNLLLTDLIASPLSLALQMDGDLQIDLSITVQILESGAAKLRLEVQNASHLLSGAGAQRDEA